MSNRVKIGLLGLACFLLGCLLAPQLPFAHAQDTKSPKWLHGLDLRVRKAGHPNFDDSAKTLKYGIEVFKDENNGNLNYITETGSFAVVAGKLTAGDAAGKEAEWQYGMDLKVRKAASGAEIRKMMAS